MIGMVFAPMLVKFSIVPSLSKLAPPMPVMLSHNLVTNHVLSPAYRQVSSGPIGNNGLQILLRLAPVKTQQLPIGEAAAAPFHVVSKWS
jgi:hypothetical protein